MAIVLVASCQRERAAEKKTCEHCGAVASTETVTRALEPWETIDPMFEGCAGGCGLRADGPTEGVVVQPGAAIGHATYCLVSGVVFDITEASVKREVDGKTFWFCCEGCAQHFTAHTAEVLALRGLG
jgi:YHS domain-containing protein